MAPLVLLIVWFSIMGFFLFYSEICWSSDVVIQLHVVEFVVMMTSSLGQGTSRKVTTSINITQRFHQPLEQPIYRDECKYDSSKLTPSNIHVRQYAIPIYIKSTFRPPDSRGSRVPDVLAIYPGERIDSHFYETAISYRSPPSPIYSPHHSLLKHEMARYSKIFAAVSSWADRGTESAYKIASCISLPQSSSIHCGIGYRFPWEEHGNDCGVRCLGIPFF
ncbi:hypothetical protein L211DRAFT_845640 [Terfezia boudieri ATCC MYA-4762]|uniref:Uncharacterized protein n=1 Tax=Terfezia boudieri ATCC MYA-4762 TaxID=1051890 RepID=A0A3N4M0B2_9PEZI|nr:hypothetical protein L211DRAFT_845640 [Terfezia boudieri ATCC MYA-4762]